VTPSDQPALAYPPTHSSALPLFPASCRDGETGRGEREPEDETLATASLALERAEHEPVTGDQLFTAGHELPEPLAPYGIEVTCAPLDIGLKRSKAARLVGTATDRLEAVPSV
jgi:hypothetical protein